MRGEKTCAVFLMISFWTVAVLSVVAACLFGGKTERLGACVVLAMMLIGIVGRLTGKGVFNTVDLNSLTQDLVGFAGFSLLALRLGKAWPIVAAACQLLSIGAHVVRIFAIDVRPVVYAWMKSGPTWGVMVLLLIGTAVHQSKIRQQRPGARALS